MALLSLIACIVLTPQHHTVAFYSPATRAWELLAGACLAVASTGKVVPVCRLGWMRFSQAVGLFLVCVSCYVVPLLGVFPGYSALLPVAGTLLILAGSRNPESWTTQLLEFTPMVAIGKLSYSLYLWHWPLFSFIDYLLYGADPIFRLMMKCILTAAFGVSSYLLIENPFRVRLSRNVSIIPVFGGMAATALCLSVICFQIRSEQYINASERIVEQGGLIYQHPSPRGKVLLWGDSIASMYGTAIKRYAEQSHSDLIVVSVTGKDPLPQFPPSTAAAALKKQSLWAKTLRVVEDQQPDVMVLACAWDSKLKEFPERVGLAVDQLKKHCGTLLILLQPPVLPKQGLRSGIRNGETPPFFEDPDDQESRSIANRYLSRFKDRQVFVIDPGQIFVEPDGALRYQTSRGRHLFHDQRHLSSFGADLVIASLQNLLVAKQKPSDSMAHGNRPARSTLKRAVGFAHNEIELERAVQLDNR